MRTVVKVIDRRGIGWISEMDDDDPLAHATWESDLDEQCGTFELNTNYGPFVGLVFEKQKGAGD